LFWEYVRILNEVKPKYFLLENVASMKKADRETITKIMGVEPIMINSALVSAQQRKRLYWTNIKGIEHLEDKHIYLKDVLENGYTEKEKSYVVVASMNNGIAERDYFLKSQRQIVFNKPVRVDTIGKGGQANRVYSIDGKSV
jgi:Site-specific DNA methylase